MTSNSTPKKHYALFSFLAYSPKWGFGSHYKNFDILLYFLLLYYHHHCVSINVYMYLSLIFTVCSKMHTLDVKTYFIISNRSSQSFWAFMQHHCCLNHSKKFRWRHFPIKSLSLGKIQSVNYIARVNPRWASRTPTLSFMTITKLNMIVIYR